MKRIGLLLLMFSCLAVTLVQCKKDDTPPPPPEPLPKPTAGFNYSRTDSVDFLSYQFKSNSTNYSELLWQFGDDSTSTEVAPSHKYAFEGKYYVKLTTRNADGYSASKEILLDIQDPNFDRTKVGESYFKTVGGILTVSRDNGGGPNAGEGSLKVVDGDINTKFLQSGFAGDLKMTFELDTPKVAGAYTLISANDAPARDPKNFNLQGSEDGIKWITLDNRTGEIFTARFQRKLYHFNNSVSYKFYRLNVKSNGGDRLFQLAEWTVNKKQP